MKFLRIFFNISEPIGKMIFPQLSLLQLWRHITFICISKWRPPYQKFLHFECKYLENQRWYWKTVNGILSYFIRSYIWDQHVFRVNFPFNLLLKRSNQRSIIKLLINPELQFPTIWEPTFSKFSREACPRPP